jgi:hypothetical protein
MDAAGSSDYSKREREIVDEFLGPDSGKLRDWVTLLRSHFHTSRLKSTLLAAAGPNLRQRIPRIAMRHMDYLIKWLKINDPRFGGLLGEHTPDDWQQPPPTDLRDLTFEDPANHAELADYVLAPMGANPEVSPVKGRLPSIYTLDCMGHFPRGSL